MPRKHIGFFLAVALMLAGIAFVAWPHPVAAQCGSSASSCKDCHEVKKQDPVNTKGVWHTAHAFGDFCEFCHAGNVKAKDKAAAHTGMISPLADPKGSCQSCHPDDYLARATKFAGVLGVPINASGALTATNPGTSAPVAPNSSSAPCGPAAPTGGQVIDLNKIYAASINPVPTNNVGNLVLLALIAGTLAIAGGLGWHYEHPVERGIQAWRSLLAGPALATASASGAARPELGTLMPLLSSSNPETLRAVGHILSDAENGPRILQAVSHMDLETLAALGETDQKALGALLALAKEMKA